MRNEEQEVQEVCQDDNETEQDETEQYDDIESRKCKVCDYTAAKLIFLKSHMLKQKDTNKCEKCNKVFPDKKGFEAHMKASHASKSYACGKFNRMFPDKKGLEAHTKASHASKHYACTECDGKFTVEHALKQHNKAVHKK